MCTARKQSLFLNDGLFWMFSDLQSVLFPPLERNSELKGNTRWPFLWHELGNSFWKGHVCLDFMACSKDWQEDMGAVGLLRPLLGNGVTFRDVSLSWGDLGSLSLPMESITIKSLSWSWEAGSSNERQHSAQWPLSWAIVLLDIAGETIICWDSGRSVLGVFWIDLT